MRQTSIIKARHSDRHKSNFEFVRGYGGDLAASERQRRVRGLLFVQHQIVVLFEKSAQRHVAILQEHEQYEGDFWRSRQRR